MANIKLWHWIAMQGLGVFVMAVGLYVLYNERIEATHKVSECNERVIALYERQTAVIDKLNEQVVILTALFDDQKSNNRNGKKN